MSGFSRQEGASRASVDVAHVDELIAVGIISAAEEGLSPGDVRRIGIMRSLQEAGLPLDGMARGHASPNTPDRVRSW
jgi:hypothetical protein